jgi:hypothetical protein
MKNVTFYTKLNCPLCDEAYQMLVMIALDMPLKIDILDITHAHNKLEAARYGDQIPVVALPQGRAELGWPFTFDELRAFLEQ